MTLPTLSPPGRSIREAMALLGSGVPLSLLLDLAMGPHSSELLAEERVSAGRADRVRAWDEPRVKQ